MKADIEHVLGPMQKSKEEKGAIVDFPLSEEDKKIQDIARAYHPLLVLTSKCSCDSFNALIKHSGPMEQADENKGKYIFESSLIYNIDNSFVKFSKEEQDKINVKWILTCPGSSTPAYTTEVMKYTEENNNIIIGELTDEIMKNIGKDHSIKVIFDNISYKGEVCQSKSFEMKFKTFNYCNDVKITVDTANDNGIFTFTAKKNKEDITEPIYTWDILDKLNKTVKNEGENEGELFTVNSENFQEYAGKQLTVKLTPTFNYSGMQCHSAPIVTSIKIPKLEKIPVVSADVCKDVKLELECFLDNKTFTVFVTLNRTYVPAKYTWTVGEKSFPESDDNFLNLPREEYKGEKHISCQVKFNTGGKQCDETVEKQFIIPNMALFNNHILQDLGRIANDKCGEDPANFKTAILAAVLKSLMSKITTIETSNIDTIFGNNPDGPRKVYDTFIKHGSLKRYVDFGIKDEDPLFKHSKVKEIYKNVETFLISTNFLKRKEKGNIFSTKGKERVESDKLILDMIVNLAPLYFNKCNRNYASLKALKFMVFYHFFITLRFTNTPCLHVHTPDKKVLGIVTPAIQIFNNYFDSLSIEGSRYSDEDKTKLSPEFIVSEDSKQFIQNSATFCSDVVTWHAEALNKVKKGGSFTKINDLLSLQKAWEEMESHFNSLPQEIQKLLPELEPSPMDVVKQMTGGYISEKSDKDFLEEARNAVGLLSFDEFEEALDIMSPTFNRIEYIYRKAFSKISEKMLPIFIKIDMLNYINE